MTSTLSVTDLEEKIENTRITYPRVDGGGVRVGGSEFTCEFDEPVVPEEFCEEVTTPDDPWRMFGVQREIDDEYWKLAGVLFHVAEDEVVDSSKITLEVAPEWVRVYVKEGCSAERAAEFLVALDAEFGISVAFKDEDPKRIAESAHGDTNE